ncbi:hypothetical protein [Weissella bombi]|uniref:Uncharacterized protein n=1 Tax=Weissella bombi TaxID=1505725 RepID=A0A1C3YTK9_9LACO|nr:hypothetical protein [Weissella bombi]SCB73358.1 hypothetical protein GA0061074_101120 [Weissella bombi]
MGNKINTKIQRIVKRVIKKEVPESAIIMNWPSRNWTENNVQKLFNIYEIFSLIEDEFDIEMPVEFYPKTVMDIEQKVAELI